MNKHLKRLILAMLTLVMVLSCLPVFSAFATEEAEPTDPPAPAASLTIEGDKVLFKKNETVPFVVSGVGEREELWILAPGQTLPTKQEGDFNDETVELSFAVSGKYTAYVLTWVGEASQQSAPINFNVGIPTTATITLDTEDTLFAVDAEVPFTVGGDGEKEEIWVIAPGETTPVLKAENLNDESYTLTFSADGVHKVFVKSYLDEEFLQSEAISFHVGKPTVSNIPSLRTTCTVGETVTFPVEINGTQWNVTAIAPDGTEHKITEQTGETFSLTLSQEGVYRLQLEAVNENGNCLSEEFTFTVYPPLDVATPDTNSNPGTTTEQGPLPPDYTWLIVLAVVVVVAGLITLIVFLKINKKKKKKAQVMQDAQ